MQKTVYVCGPLTDLPKEDHDRVKGFYSRIADCCETAIGLRGFVPHEHYDPVRFAHFSPKEIDQAERDQVCNKTSIVVAMYLAPSWGGGIEVEMANRSGVPVIIACPTGKKVSRLLAGNPVVKTILYYECEDHALQLIMEAVTLIAKDVRQYPKFLMQIGEEQEYLPLKQAGIAYDSGWVKVRICGEVLEYDGTVRPITDKEREAIAEIAEEWSASK